MTDRIVVVRAPQRVKVRDTTTVLRVVRAPQRVVVAPPSQERLTVVREPQRVVVRGLGLQGPPGPPGADGTGGGGGGSGLRLLERSFASPVTTWTFQHDLNTFAIEVNAYQPDGLTEKPCTPEFVDANTVQITWFYPETGVVRLLY